jgi:hypothetical protein
MGKVFQFSSSASLQKLTGLTAENLEGLLDLIRACPDSSIFYHTFSAFLKMREAQVPYNSDFAIWVADMLNEKALAEKLTALDLSEYNTIKTLRGRLIEIIELHRHEKPKAFQKIADEPFYLYDVVRVVYLTDKFAYDLTSFRELLATVSIYSIYFHFIESRLQTHLQKDDFSTWIEESLNLPDLARRIMKIDISVYTMEELRSQIIEQIDQYMGTPQP